MGRSTLISMGTTQAHIQTPSRMNKLLMLAFLVALMGLMATAAPQDEVEELELEDMAEDEAMEDVVESREAREAGRRRQRQRQRAGLKRSMKKKKTENENKKKTKKQKKSRPGPERNGASRSNGCGRSSTDYSCLIKAMTYLNLTKTQVANYLKQQGRIVAANKTGEKKNGKKGIFASTAQRIIRSGGGNSAALSCQGSTNSSGAKNLTDLATLLNGCEVKVKAACSTDNMPLPNMTEVSACLSAMTTFKGMVDTCQMEMTNGTAACTCWSNSNSTGKKRAAASCAEIITIVTEIKTIVAANPENSTVTTLTTKITSVASTVTCSDDEKTSLATSSSDLAAAKESVDGSLATIKEDLEIATGSAPTESDISGATTASSTATAASSARRNIVARHLLNRFNLN